MQANAQDPKKNDAEETVEELKDQTQNGKTKKGYNEQNPAQPGGAFVPDGKDEKTSDEPPQADDL